MQENVVTPMIDWKIFFTKNKELLKKSNLWND